MGNHITLGFREIGRKAKPELLFLGQDSGEATKVFTNPPPGIVRTEMLNHVPFTRQRNHDGSGVGFEGVVPELLVGVVVRDDATVEEVAGILYESYCAAVGGKAYNGDLLPSWVEFRADESKKLQSDAWVVVAGLHPSEPDEVKAAADAATMLERIEVLEGENLKLLEEVKLLRDAAGTACGETPQPLDGAGRPGNGLGQDALATGEGAAGGDAPAGESDGGGEALNLGLPAKSGKAAGKK
jgi:hypothetical protein